MMALVDQQALKQHFCSAAFHLLGAPQILLLYPLSVKAVLLDLLRLSWTYYLMLKERQMNGL